MGRLTTKELTEKYGKCEEIRPRDRRSCNSKCGHYAKHHCDKCNMKLCRKCKNERHKC